MARPSEYPQYRRVILRIVEWTWKEQGRAPTLRDLSDATGISLGTAQKYIKRLHEEGLVQWTPKKHRSIKLSKQGQEALSSPR